MSEPEYFYTVELPEKFGRLLERLAAWSRSDPEALAASLLCDALKRADKDHETALADALGGTEPGEHVPR